MHSIGARAELAGDWYLTLFSALTLALLRDRGQEETAALEGALFARYQSTHFLPALDKLGLAGEPTDAIRCAKYHYLANSLGGLHMEYVEETPHKVWVRYLPPCYAYDSPSRPSAGLAALGSAYGEAPMRAWHANNGRLLGNPRLGFVMTQVQADGDPWDGGYFFEAGHDLGPEETFRRTRGEWGPRFDPARAPVLPEAAWPAERRAAARRNYAVNYAALKLALLVERLGEEAAAGVVRHACAVMFAQRCRWLAEVLDVADPGTPAGAAALISRLGAITGDDIGVEPTPDGGAEVHIRTSRLHARYPAMPASLEGALAAGWACALRVHNPELSLRVVKSLAGGDGPGVWVLAERAGG